MEWARPPNWFVPSLQREVRGKFPLSRSKQQASEENTQGQSTTIEQGTSDTGPWAPQAPRSTADSDRSVVLSIDDVSKYFGDLCAVDNFSIEVVEGELLTLLGPSGGGKTTLLRLIAGLEQPDTGSILIDGEHIASPTEATPPESRDVGLVFQDFALFPHLSVAENVAFGLDDDHPRPDERVDEMLELVNLSSYRDHAPDQLSGGQKQRVALARSLAPSPAVLLLDEPFSNLDVSLRVAMREEVRRILKEAGVTAVSVTHDQEEALSISDRVAVLNEGALEQVGRPETVFEHPASRFVADFLGQAGFLSGFVHGDEIETGIGTFEADRLKGITDAYDGTRLDILVRPDDLAAHAVDDEKANGTIVHRDYTGPAFVYRIELHNGDIVHCQHNHVQELDIGKAVKVELIADHTLAWYPPATTDETP